MWGRADVGAGFSPPLFFFANLLLLTLLRLAFFLAFRHTTGPLITSEVLFAFYLGLKFDARLMAILTLPLLAIRRGAAVYIAVMELMLLLVYAIDFGSYGYIHRRVNAGLLELLNNPLISLHMVWESYHVVLFGATILAVVVLIVWAVRRTTRAPRGRARFTWIFAIFLIACLYGKISRYPLRWSDAYFSSNRFIGDVAMNPPQFFFDSMREKPAAYDVARLRKLYPQLAEYLSVEQPDANKLTFGRQPQIHPLTTGNPNVVLIQLESVAAFKLGVFGNRMNASPSLDSLARNGWLFTRHYTPSEKTARALFAVMFGIPDVSPWQASANNPLTIDQTSIAGAFTGYEKLYFLGGSANWSNIRGMLAHNIDGLRIYEEGSYREKPVDVWGITDEDLMLEANEVFRREQRPFFAVIQTAGNHRPYTIPEKTHGFVSEHVTDEQLRNGWFESNEELNGFRYLDHAVGLFMQAAQRETYFNNTIFVLYGDHGTRTGAPGSEQAMGDLSDIVYHVPLILYGPGILKTPRTIDTPSSHLDILPMLASLCGKPYVDRTLGIDILDPLNAAKSSAFYFTTFHDPPDLATIDRNGMTVTRSNDPSPTLGRAFYEASRWLLYHNR